MSFHQFCHKRLDLLALTTSKKINSINKLEMDPHLLNRGNIIFQEKCILVLFFHKFLQRVKKIVKPRRNIAVKSAWVDSHPNRKVNKVNKCGSNKSVDLHFDGICVRYLRRVQARS